MEHKLGVPNSVDPSSTESFLHSRHPIDEREIENNPFLKSKQSANEIYRKNHPNTYGDIFAAYKDQEAEAKKGQFSKKNQEWATLQNYKEHYQKEREIQEMLQQKYGGVNPELKSTRDQPKQQPMHPQVAGNHAQAKTHQPNTQDWQQDQHHHIQEAARDQHHHLPDPQHAQNHHQDHGQQESRRPSEQMHRGVVDHAGNQHTDALDSLQQEMEHRQHPARKSGMIPNPREHHDHPEFDNLQHPGHPLHQSAMLDTRSYHPTHSSQQRPMEDYHGSNLSQSMHLPNRYSSS